MTDPAGRILHLLSLLQRRVHWTGPQLAEELGVTTRTVRRDIDRLRDLGYPVDAESGPEGGYRMGVGGELPPLLLDDDEAFAVVIALSISASGAGLEGGEGSALAALAKLDRLLPPQVRRRVGALRASTDRLGATGTPGEFVATGILVTLAQAVDGDDRLVCNYVDREGRRTERRIEPHRLVATNRRWYLLAFDLDRDDWRVFRVDRIVEATVTGHRFERRPHEDAATMVGRSITTSPYRWQAVVQFDADVEQLRERVPPSVGMAEPSATGGSVLRVGSDDLLGLSGHLIGIGLPFEVLEPVELRAHLRHVGRWLGRAHR